jgi:hypothetical protein
MFSSYGFSYFIFLIDVHTKHIWYYPLIEKSNVFFIFHHFQMLIECWFSHKIKSIQIDWGGEYHKLNNFFQTIGTHHRLICHYIHEQNDTIERHHRYLSKIFLPS